MEEQKKLAKLDRFDVPWELCAHENPSRLSL